MHCTGDVQCCELIAKKTKKPFELFWNVSSRKASIIELFLERTTHKYIRSYRRWLILFKRLFFNQVYIDRAFISLFVFVMVSFFISLGTSLRNTH